MEQLFEPQYKGLRLILSRAAAQELHHEGMDVGDLLTILYEGETSPRKRAVDTIERRLARGTKIQEIVVCKDYNALLREEIWLVTHIGVFTK